MTSLEHSVSTIIVTYNSSDCIDICLESLINDKAIKEIYVIDNASTDSTQSIISQHSHKHTFVKHIYNKLNYGLAHANNQPMHLCSGKYILILNPDTIMHKNTILNMAYYLDTHPNVGAIGPKTYFEDGTPHVTYHSSWTIASPIIWRFLPYTLVRYIYDKIFGQYKQRSVLFISGACLMLPRSLYLNIGGYDETYFLAVEDAVDLCLRIKKYGYTVLYYPSAEVTHLGGRSGRQVKSLSLYMGCQGNIYHQKKHYGYLWAFVLHALLIFNLLIKIPITALLSLLLPSKYKPSLSAYLYATHKLLTDKIPPIPKTHI
jgi:hypothetical protein